MRLKIFSYNIRGLPVFPDIWSAPLTDWFNNSTYDFVCLQEVFTDGRVKLLTNALEKNGYTVIKPDDFAIRTNLLGSGLLTAVKNCWTILDTGFQFYELSTTFENITNKGFHWLKLSHKKTDTQITIVNTHMQADNPINLITGCIDTRPIRKSQALQILKHFASKQNHLIIGDINSESEPHEDLLYLTGKKANIQKHTFIPTGEDLDHVAIIPKMLHRVPKLSTISVLTKIWWSDHWPIYAVVDL